MTQAERGRFAFLYRSDQGTLGAHEWWRAALPLLALFALATAGWLFAHPYALRSLARRGFIEPSAIAANLYLIFYTLAVLLLGVCWVNLCAKRFRDRGRMLPLGLAGLLPLAMLADGALRWLQPRIVDTLPGWSVYFGDALVAAVLAWTLAECFDLVRPTPRG